MTAAPVQVPPAQGAPMRMVLLNLLTPLLAAGGLTEPALARRAAADVLADCRAQGEVQLLSAAQLVGYGVAGLDLLQIGACSAAPLDEQVRLRNAASRLGLMSARAARTLETRQREAGAAISAEFAPHDVAEETAALADLAATTQRLREVREAGEHPADDKTAGRQPNPNQPAPFQQPPHQARPRPTGQAPDRLPGPAPARAKAAPGTAPSERSPLTPAEQRAHKLMWAGAMTQVAQESAAHLPALPAAERRLEGIRISALCSVARGLTDAANLLPRIVPPSGPPRPG